MKTNLCGRNFGSTEAIIDAVNEFFVGPGRRLLFRRDKQQHCRKCTEEKGDYFEKLEIVFVKHYAPNHMLASKDNTR